jgi:hypothetical protein
VYDTDCDVWQMQGHAKSAAFPRALYSGGTLPALRARSGVIANYFARVAGRANFPRQIRNAHLEGLRARMQRLEVRWRRRIEAEAKEGEHLERREKSRVHGSAAEGNQQSRRLTKPLLLKYRSRIKLAILLALTKNPRAADVEVCRFLDADGGEELPIGWRNRREDRSFFDAYKRPPTKRNIEIAISKVRRDLRDRGFLS